MLKKNLLLEVVTQRVPSGTVEGYEGELILFSFLSSSLPSMFQPLDKQGNVNEVRNNRRKEAEKWQSENGLSGNAQENPAPNSVSAGYSRMHLKIFP